MHGSLYASNNTATIPFHIALIISIDDLDCCLHHWRSTSDQTISPVLEAYHNPRSYSSSTSIYCPFIEVVPRLLKHGTRTTYGRFTPNSNRHALPFRYDRVCWHRDCTGLLHTGISFCYPYFGTLQLKPSSCCGIAGSSFRSLTKILNCCHECVRTVSQFRREGTLFRAP